MEDNWKEMISLGYGENFFLRALSAILYKDKFWLQIVRDFLTILINKHTILKTNRVNKSLDNINRLEKVAYT